LTGTEERRFFRPVVCPRAGLPISVHRSVRRVIQNDLPVKAWLLNAAARFGITHVLAYFSGILLRKQHVYHVIIFPSSRDTFFFCINSYLSKIGSCALASPIFGIFRRCFFSEPSALPFYFVGAKLLQIINMVARSLFLSVELAALQLQRQTVVF
jgi:hypothetical protein